MAFFSVIVPVYNVQAYLREAIASVQMQDFTDVEIVVVDDATPDHSGAIADQMAADDPRITVVHLPANVGLGMARNAGIAAATGDYLLFLDGDDTLAPGSLSAIATKLQRNDCPELLIFNYPRFWWDGRQAVSWGAEQLAQLSTQVFAPADHPELFTLLPISCSKAYRRDFLQRLAVTFPTGFYEDISFTYTVLLNARTAVTLNQVVLMYRQRRGGGNILKTTSDKHFDIFAQYDTVFAEAERTGLNPAARKKLYDVMINHYVTIITSADRIARSQRRAFFAASGESARKLQRTDIGDHRSNAASDLRGRLMRDQHWGRFRAYVWLDRKRSPARRAAGKVYWPVRRVLRKVRALGRLSYRWHRMRPIDEQLVVFSEYWGTGFGCNPRAIFEQLPAVAPGLKAVWILTDSKAAALPPGTPHVQPDSLAQWKVLARAKYFVSNVNFPGAYVKRPGQVHVQTMHGTPLKYCGLDVLNSAGAAMAVDPRRNVARQDGNVVTGSQSRMHQEFADMLVRSDRWDYAISSNAYSTEMWSHAYPCNYQWLEVGYPRNDVLVTAGAADVAAARARLGIADDTIAVLYAPTFRETTGDPSLRVDVAALAQAAGPEYVFIVRAHHTATFGGALDALIDIGTVIDGSSIASISDCYLAADVLITDYSSVMFDYAHLDRPIVIYADDWDSYRQVRGAYFDLMAQPPGAIARTQRQIQQLFTTGDYDTEQTTGLRTSFRSRFCSFDDGHAAEAVIRQVMLPSA